MGRVYKALLKAERFQGADRPIGRPDRGAARGDATQGFLRKPYSAATIPFEVEESFELTEDPASIRYAESSALTESTTAPSQVRVPALFRKTPPRLPVVRFRKPLQRLRRSSHLKNRARYSELEI